MGILDILQSSIVYIVAVVLMLVNWLFLSDDPKVKNQTQNNTKVKTEVNESQLATNGDVTNIYGYPKCPICRCRNEEGGKQVVFATNDGFRCHRGHNFTGKEW